MTEPNEPTPPAPAPTPDPAPAPTPPAPPEQRGFPADTAVAEMTVAQQAAYWQHQARKHEGRATEYRTAAGGKTAAEIRADLEAAEALRTSQMSAAEKAVEQARSAARQEVAAEYGTRLVAAEFKAALAGVDGERRDQIINGLNLSAYLTDKGDVDTAKVQSYAAVIAPAKDKGNGLDYGNGRRSDTGKTGVSAGREAFEARKKTPSSSL